MLLVGINSADEVELIELGYGESQVLKVNSSLDNMVESSLVNFLRENLTVFA